jgi:hypothetical protein
MIQIFIRASIPPEVVPFIGRPVINLVIFMEIAQIADPATKSGHGGKNNDF